jgi:methylphosphotriester-DNA--protein-cysteine methyltransferase
VTAQPNRNKKATSLAVEIQNGALKLRGLKLGPKRGFTKPSRLDMVIKNGTTKTDSQNTQQQQIPQQQQQQKQSPESHSVILVTAGYDNTIRFWEALSGICSRTIQHPNSVSNSKESGSHEVHILFTMEIIASE